MNEALLQEARQQATAWARHCLKIPPEKWAILDTETTGLDEKAEVIQIGIINGRGARLMNNVLVKPLGIIPAEATAVHGITIDMAEKGISFPKAFQAMMNVLDRMDLLVIYNKAYDMRLIGQSCKLHGITSTGRARFPRRVNCAMLAYAQYQGQWDPRRNGFRWPKLTGGDHSAVGDCIATKNVIESMAEVACPL